ncbi:MAG: DNA-binding protein [Methanospirillum sp.]|nr:DNA-binding protein [Methanospirillum sp.]
MKYASGTCGRIFYLHIEHGEDPIRTITGFIREHGVHAGVINLIGAVRNTRLVTGPKEDLLPHEPRWEEVPDAHELVGIGIIRSGAEGPAVHIHMSAGRGDTVLTGCIRGNAEAFIIVEAVITEFSGIELPLVPDALTRMDLPDPKSQSPV